MTEKKANPVIGYFQESVLELRKVTWPTRNQAVKLTVIVLGFCIVAALFIGLADSLFNLGYAQLLELARKQ